MLLNGMKVTKKVFLITVFSVLVGLACLLLSRVFISCKNEQNPDCDYYTKMLLLLETSSEFKMQEVFDFEFDKVYVAYEVYGDEKSFVNKLGVETDVDIPVLESGGHCRMLFVKNNKIIYDFVYEKSKLCVHEAGMWVYPDTAVKMMWQDCNGQGVFEVLGTHLCIDFY